MSEVGFTILVPLVATFSPLSVAELASCVCQVSSTASPGFIDVLSAVRSTHLPTFPPGGGVVVTFTVTTQGLLPVAPGTTPVYVVVVVGLTVLDPCGTCVELTPLMLIDGALSEVVQVRTTASPGATVVLSAESARQANTGDGGVVLIFTDAVQCAAEPVMPVAVST